MLHSKAQNSIIASRFQFGRFANSRRRRLICTSSSNAKPVVEDDHPKTWWRSPYDSQILNLAVPTLCSNVLTPLSNSIDAAVVGQLGPAQLSGVGLASMTLGFCTSFLFAIPILITPLIAQKDARGEDVSLDIAQGLLFTCLLGIVASIFISASSGVVLHVMKPAAEIRPFAEAYLRTVAFLPPGTLLLQCLGGIYRGMKDGRSVFKASLSAVLVNVSLDLLFVFKFGWSVIGVALATIFSIYASVGILIWQLICQKKLKISDLTQTPNFTRFLPMLNDGLRLGVRSLLLFGILFTSSTLVARTGAIVHSAYEICRQTSVLTYVIYGSIEQTVQALAATAIGRKDLLMGRQVITRALKLAVGACLLTVLVLLVFSPQVAGLYTSNPSVIAAFVLVAPVHFLWMPIAAMVSVIDGALIGAQRSRVVANTQSIGAVLGIGSLFLMQRSSLVTLLWVLIVIRLASTLHGVVTGYYLFFSKKNPYGFAEN